MVIGLLPATPKSFKTRSWKCCIVWHTISLFANQHINQSAFEFSCSKLNCTDCIFYNEIKPPDNIACADSLLGFKIVLSIVFHIVQNIIIEAMFYSIYVKVYFMNLILTNYTWTFLVARLGQYLFSIDTKTTQPCIYMVIFTYILYLSVNTLFSM